MIFFVTWTTNNFADTYSKFDSLLAVGAKHEIIANTGSAFDELEQFRIKHPGWVTGFLTYDLKNEVENLSSSNIDQLHFPDLYFFVPENIILVTGGEIEVISSNPSQVLKEIESQERQVINDSPNISLLSRFSKEEYIEKVKKVKDHINRGDIYVTNFCQEFYAEVQLLIRYPYS